MNDNIFEYKGKKYVRESHDSFGIHWHQIWNATVPANQVKSPPLVSEDHYILEQRYQQYLRERKLKRILK